jgi:hypothetical protein
VNKTEQKVGVSKNNSTPAQSNSKDKLKIAQSKTHLWIKYKQKKYIEGSPILRFKIKARKKDL